MTTTATHAHDIVISGPEPLVIDPTSAKRRPVLNQDEARMLTTEIQRTSVRLWLLLTEAHDRAAHFALGYDSWDDYVRAEFKMSPSRSYQLIDTGHVMRELAVAGIDVDTMPPPPTRVISRIKDRLPEIRKAARAAHKAGEDPTKVLREMAREPREPKKGAGPQVPRARAGDDAITPDSVDDSRVIAVTCPGCGGDGKVTRSMANRLRAFMRTLPVSE